MNKIWSAFLFAFLLLSCKNDASLNDKGAINSATDTSIEKPIVEKFGFKLNEFTVLQDTVRRGDSFGELMIQNKVEFPKIAKLTQDYRDTFDVGKIRVGKPYMILKSKDTTEAVQVFIYENDLINYTIVDFRDSVSAHNHKKEVRYVEREASGIIETSLSEAILNQGIDYNVTNNLAEIYAWTIDFFKLDAGDKFKIVYNEKYINDTIYAGADPIKAAYFEHRGKPIYAFAYENDSLKSIVDYFDEEANNLRRTFLRAPVKFSRVSSRYNLKRRIRYYGNRVRPHRGTDYAASIGQPILATADGVVTESTRRGGNGRYVKIRHNATYSTQYLHMKKQKVKRGDKVKQGDVIGWVGMTGNTSGPHVCYRFWRNGRQVDPYKEELPKAEPLAESLQPEYFEYVYPIKDQLDCMLYPEKRTEEEPELVSFNK